MEVSQKQITVDLAKEHIKDDRSKDILINDINKLISITENKKLIIDLEEYDYTGSSNDIYGMVVKVNGVEMPYHNMDVDTILEQVLTHLGYEVEINRTFDN